MDNLLKIQNGKAISRSSIPQVSYDVFLKRSQLLLRMMALSFSSLPIGMKTQINLWRWFVTVNSLLLAQRLGNRFDLLPEQ